MFLEVTLRRLQSLGCRQLLAYSPSEQRLEFEELLSKERLSDWRLVPQGKGDLGNRMQDYFHASFQSGAEIVVLMGSDSPDYPSESLIHGIKWLEQSKERGIFLGPSNDGGYWAVGMKGELAPIFEDMPWSDSSLFNKTLERLNRAGWSEGTDIMLLDKWYDVDDLNDLKLLNQRLENLTEEGETLASLRQRIQTIIKR